MSGRNATKEDIYDAIETARDCLANRNETWKVRGQDMDGDDLDLIVSIEGSAVIITVF